MSLTDVFLLQVFTPKVFSLISVTEGIKINGFSEIEVCFINRVCCLFSYKRNGRPTLETLKCFGAFPGLLT